MSSPHRLVVNAVVPVSASLVGNTRGILFRIAGTTAKTETTTASTTGPRTRAMSVIKIEITINRDRCKERTGKGANVVSDIINETNNQCGHTLAVLSEKAECQEK